MTMTNKTYDFLNKLHRVVLVLIQLLGVATVMVQALNEQSVTVPAIVTTIIAVAQAVLGYLLQISSKNYWANEETAEETSEE